MSQHHYAEFGEALDLEEKLLRIRVFRHGRRCKLSLERLNPPLVVTRPEENLDKGGTSAETMGRSTT